MQLLCISKLYDIYIDILHIYLYSYIYIYIFFVQDASEKNESF